MPVQRRAPKPPKGPPVQRIPVVRDNETIRAPNDQDKDVVETKTLAPSARVELIHTLRKTQEHPLLGPILEEWLAEPRDHSALIAAEADKVALLATTYAKGFADPAELQASIGRVVADYVENVVAGAMAGLGVDADEFAILLVGSAARGEMFPASDIDLLLIGEELPKAVAKAIEADIKHMTTEIVVGAQKLLKQDAGSGKLPFSLDACLVGSLFHTPESAADAALTGYGSNDNMVADTLLLNGESEGAQDNYGAFLDQYQGGLNEKDQARRRGFLPERLLEMDEKVKGAFQQLKEKEFGFDVKKGLLRPPSLVARDYFTWRSELANDPKTTIGRLDSFRVGDKATQLSGGAVGALKEGMQYGTELRLKLHLQHGGEVDELSPAEKEGERKQLDSLLSGYLKALNEILEVAAKAELAPRPARMVGKLQQQLVGNTDKQFKDLQKTGFKKKNCFLTTACTEARGLPDDCEELTVLRAFRDGPLQHRAEGPALIERYYQVAPAIVAAIDAGPAPAKAWNAVYGEVRACVDAILDEREDEAVRRYTRLVTRLARRHGVALRA